MAGADQPPLLVDLGARRVPGDLIVAVEPVQVVELQDDIEDEPALGVDNIEECEIAEATGLNGTQIMLTQLNELTRAIGQINDRMERYAGTEKLGFREFKLSFRNQQDIHRWGEKQSKSKLISSLTGAALSFCAGLQVELYTTNEILVLLQRYI